MLHNFSCWSQQAPYVSNLYLLQLNQQVVHCRSLFRNFSTLVSECYDHWMQYLEQYLALYRSVKILYQKNNKQRRQATDKKSLSTKSAVQIMSTNDRKY